MSNSLRYRSNQACSHARADASAIERHAPLLIGAGIALGAMAAFVQYRTRQVEKDNPPTGKFIEVDGVRLHYLERGQGQPVVIFHGNGAMAQEIDLSGILDLASQKYRVIVFDRPGYGYSDRPRSTIWGPVAQAKLFHQALQKIGVNQATVVGHSWGTMVATALALEYPNDVQSMLLLSGYYYPTPRLDAPLSSPPAIPIVGDLLRYTIAPLIGRMMWPAMVRKLFSPAKTTARFKKDYPIWMGLRPSQIRASSAEGAMMIPSAYKLKSRYQELRMPVIIMAGAGDLQALPRLHSERLHRDIPHSELLLVPETGHMIQHSEPMQVLSAIDQAVAAIPTRRPLAQPPAVEPTATAAHAA